MKLNFVFVFVIILIMSGCTAYQPKIYINGSPSVSDVTYSSNPATGISTISFLTLKSEKHEGDEKYESSNFFSPVQMHEFKKKNVSAILYDLSINNKSFFRKNGKGFYYKLYKITRVINHKNKTLDNQVKLIYKGHLSFKKFMFELPSERGDEVNCVFELRSKKEDVMFKTLEINYKII